VRQVIATIALFAALVGAAVPASSATSPAYIVVDVEDGTVLSHRSADKPWYPASITKVMTAYVVFRALAAGEITLQSPVKVSRNALNEPPSKMGYKVGTVMTVDNALKMMIVKSANDIAVAIGESVAGSEAAFVARMNAEARRLGMRTTNFNNPNGLPDSGQISSARDLAVLGRAAWLDFPQHRHYFRITAIQAGTKVIRSYNTLLGRYRGANGMKTGFICDSGYNLMGSATRNGRTLIVVVLGAPSGGERAELAASLLTRGFQRWLSPWGRPNVATLGAAGSSARPVSLRPEICSAEARAARAQAGQVGPVKSALVPRFALMDPVRVFTGGVAAPAPNIPLPRLRPKRAEDRSAAALGGGAATTAVQ